MTDFLTAAKKHLISGLAVAVDEQLKAFRERSRHTLTITSKEAGRDFKSYCLTSEKYLYSFKFTSKTTKISGLIKPKGQRLPNTQAVVTQLLRELPKPMQYVAYTDNFFTTTKLANVLRSNEIALRLVGTCKNKSDMLREQLKLKKLSSKAKNWGLKTVTIDATKNVLCMTWQNNNTMQLMSTAHSSEEAMRESEKNGRNPLKRKGIPDSSFRKRVKFSTEITETRRQISTANQESQKSLKTSDEMYLPWPQLVVDYNKHMNGLDGNAQMRAYYHSAIL